ncbi:ATP-binding protein [Candidatus Woesearchaeota archaeon]|nr:ATP-binding protein [Candidatus Woesearchaeota archaeon]
MPEKFRSTKELKVSSSIIEQVIGQENAVNIIRKAARQRRHVLLIGEPGTGKSLLGLGLAELLPKENLADIVAFSNPNDENQPMIRVMPAGDGRGMVAQARAESGGFFKNQNIIMFVLLILALITPWWAFNHYSKIGGPLLGGLMFLAFFIGGIVFLASFVLFLNFSRRMEGRGRAPKVIVDSFHKKQAPFLDATGAHAGALLGDVLHDPFQTFCPQQAVTKVGDGCSVNVEINKEIDSLFKRNKDKILKKEANGYQAIHLDKNEFFVLGETNGSVSPVEVLSSNQYVHDGPMIKLSIDGNRELVVTPEHKIAVWRNGKIEYVEAQNIKENEEIVADAKDIIIDEQDIINTYDKHQQEQCELYYQYQQIKSLQPSWGYKRIAKAMGQKIGKTRWWHAGKHMPVPLQTANWLKERGVLPFKTDNPKLPLIAKVLGATFGDGGIFENLNGIFLSSSEKEAVKEFGSDLEGIFRLNKDENSRIIESGEYGHSWCYQNTNRNLIRFFLALGAPKGNKTHLELVIPGWVKLSKDMEDEFYGSFLGGEMGTPIIHKRGNYLTSLEVGITGRPSLRDNRIQFLNELADYLKRNRVSTTSIYEGRTKSSGLVFRLQIEKKIDNVILFLANIKIGYCKYKRARLYTALGEWAMLKKNKYYELLKKGYGAERAMGILNLTPNSLYLLLNHFGPKVEATA